MKNILVVEDDKLLGKAICQTLDGAGFQTFWARNAQEAFEALEVQEINLIYLDLMLPGDTDGYEVLRQLKTGDRFSHLPVIILSNLGQLDEIERAMQLGATDYYVKANIDLKELVELTKSKSL